MFFVAFKTMFKKSNKHVLDPTESASLWSGIKALPLFILERLIDFTERAPAYLFLFLIVVEIMAHVQIWIFQLVLKKLALNVALFSQMPLSV